MRFYRISPCPRCGGKVKAKWERDGVQWLPEYTFFIVMFRCTVCGLGFEGGCSRKPPRISCNTISPLGTAYATVINASR